MCVLCAAIECVTEPETVESYEQERGDDSRERGGLCYFAHDDVEVCGDAERERDHRGEQHATGEAMKMFGLFAPLDDAMISGRRHQQHGAQRNEREACDVDRF